MQRDNIPIKVARLKKLIQDVEAEYYAELSTNRMSGWLGSVTVEKIIHHYLKMTPNHSGSFFGVYDSKRLVSDAATLKKMAAENEVRIHRKVKQQPYRFVLMPGNNHFVAVSVNQGNVTVYNELLGYDKATLTILTDLGFKKEQIKFEKINNQLDGFSCGDRALRRLFREFGIEHDIVRAVSSADMRKHSLQLIKEVLIENDKRWIDYQQRLAALQNQGSNNQSNQKNNDAPGDLPNNEKDDEDKNKKNLLDCIQLLKNYGEQLKGTKKDKVVSLADAIQKEVENYFLDKTKAPEVTRKLNEIIDEGKKTLGKDRRGLDIFLHVLLACTVVGLAILIGHKIGTGTFFLNETERQKRLKGIEEEVKNQFGAKKL